MTMLICFYDIKGIIPYECAPPKQSTKHSSFKFFNVYGGTFIKKDHIFGQIVHFAS